MDLQGQAVIPTGEKERNREARSDGAYFALSYRGKRVCIDSGLEAILKLFIRETWEPRTQTRVDQKLAEFIGDYRQVWWKSPQGEFLELTRVTASIVDKYTITLSPHYKVPNEVRDPQRLQGDHAGSGDASGATASPSPGA